jgi:hypothetical protein
LCKGGCQNQQKADFDWGIVNPSGPSGHLPLHKGGLGAPAPVRVNNNLPLFIVRLYKQKSFIGTHFLVAKSAEIGYDMITVPLAI